MIAYKKIYIRKYYYQYITDKRDDNDNVYFQILEVPLVILTTYLPV